MATLLEFIKSGDTSVPIDLVMEDAVSQCIGCLYYATTHGSTPEVISHAMKLRNRLMLLRNNILGAKYINNKPVPLPTSAYADLYTGLAGVYRDVKLLKPFLPEGSIESVVYNSALHTIGSAWSASGKLAGALKPYIEIDF